MLDYTPRRTMTLFALAKQRRRQELREQLIVATYAGRGEGADIDVLLGDLED